MYNYKYTLEVSSWSQSAQEYITDLVKKYNISYDIQRSTDNSSKVVLNLKGEKEELDKLELRLIKNLSSHTQVEDFTKTTTSFKDSIITDNSFFDIKESEFCLTSPDLEEISDPLQESVKLLKSQKVGLIKNSNGYYICAISNKTNPIKKVREIINQPVKDLPLLFKSTLQASKCVQITKKEEALLASDIKPLLKTKKKNLHRLEKVKNIPLNAVSPTNTYFVKLAKNFLEEYLVNNTNIPLIFIKIDDFKNYIEKVDFVLSFEKDYLEYDDTLLQIIYGKTQIIKAGYGLEPIKLKTTKTVEDNIVCKIKNSLSVAFKESLVLAPSGLKEEDFFILNSIKPDTYITDQAKYSIATIHNFESCFNESLIFDFSLDVARVLLSKDKSITKLYSLDKEPKDYFKECALKSTNIKDKDLDYDFHMICDNSYEICHEKSFDVVIKDQTISIDTLKELNKNEIPSALINSFTDIIKEIYSTHQLPVVLCGDIFENKNLAENIIEYFDDNSIKYHLSSKIPLNDYCSSLGTLLDIIDKK